MLTNKHGHPTGLHAQYAYAINSFNTKVFANYLACSLAEAVKQVPAPEFPCGDVLQGRLTQQADLESSWCRYWLKEMGIDFVYHRKPWELAYVAQTLHGHGMLKIGMKGLGFACGREQLPSLFSSRGCRITASDKPLGENDVNQEGWIKTQQYAQQKSDLYYSNIVSYDVFDAQVELSYIDMNNLPENGNDSFDFCWSVCAIEHLGSVNAGLNFLRNSLRLLKPGGISVHTTEFNYLDTHESLDNWGSVLFKKFHFEQLRCEVSKIGCELLPIDYSCGDNIFDKYIDMPPFPGQLVDGLGVAHPFNLAQPHLKLTVDGIPTTCIGIVLRRLQ